MFLAFKDNHKHKAGFLIKYAQKNTDCDGILLAHMAGFDRVGKMYTKLGFKEMERQFIWKKKKS